MKRFFYITLIYFLLSPCLSTLTKAQDALSLEDKVEISYQAKLLVSEYQSLLNVLSNRNITLQESRILIGNSYSPTGTRIFYDSLVVIER